MVLDGRLFHVIWSIKVRARHELSAGKMRFAWAIPNTNVFIAQTPFYRGAGLLGDLFYDLATIVAVNESYIAT